MEVKISRTLTPLFFMKYNNSYILNCLFQLVVYYWKRWCTYECVWEYERTSGSTSSYLTRAWTVLCHKRAWVGDLAFTWLSASDSYVWSLCRYLSVPLSYVSSQPTFSSQMRSTRLIVELVLLYFNHLYWFSINVS